MAIEWALHKGAAVAAPKSAKHAALGRALRAKRSARGWTLEDLGDRVPGQMNPRYISATERGEVNISFANLVRLCDALDIALSELIAEYEMAAGERKHRR